MRRTGIADLPLHGGRAPAWLFTRMARLARAVVLAMREDAPATALLARLSDPHWFHTFVFTPAGDWAVIQQGMSDATRYARRYHWLGASVTDFVSEPHSAIVAERHEEAVLNLVAGEGEAHRAAIAQAAREERPDAIV